MSRTTKGAAFRAHLDLGFGVSGSRASVLQGLDVLLVPPSFRNSESKLYTFISERGRGLGFYIGFACTEKNRNSESHLEPETLPIVSIVVPFWGYLIESSI